MKLRLLAIPVVLIASLLPGIAGAAVSDPIDPAATTAVASWGTNRLDLFAKGTDGTLKHKFYNGRWSAWESLGGAITSGPAAVSWGPGRLDVFARGTDGSVQHKAYSNGTWSAWGNLGGVAVGEPAVASWASGRLDVFVRGGTNALYHKFYSNGWSASWENLGGVLTSPPTAASWASGRLDVFARGGSNALYHKWYACCGNGWAAWENLGGALTSGPAVFSWQSGHLDVYARVANNAVSHKWYTGGWSGWTNLGGTMATAPAVTHWGTSRVDLFARATDGTLQHNIYSGGWGGWRTEVDATPTRPVQSYSRTVAMQASPSSGALVGPLEYAYVDNIGRIVSGHQPDPANAFSVQWTVISGNEAFSGEPGLLEQPDGRLQVSALHTSGDIWARAQTTKGAATWTGWIDQGGTMSSPVTVARQTDGSVVLLATDSTGGLWYVPQSNVAGPYGTWRSLGLTGLVGAPTAITGRDGVQIFGVDTTGAVRTATVFPSGAFTSWVSLGGAGFAGTPAVVMYPGYRMRVFVRAADGTIVTKAQDAALAWEAGWSTVGTQVVAGSPAAVLSPQSGRTEVVVRGAAGDIVSTGETAQGSGLWRDWVPVLQGGDVAATDP
ncbi:MAG TPA: hypothetical protein VFE14_06370, partial [Micromonosporaceae bacterium]|nr:hypothetical protein [Micromonosporaceae bacterium]